MQEIAWNKKWKKYYLKDVCIEFMKIFEAFFAVSFHLRAHEDLREELLARLQNQYNEIGGEFFSPALDFVQTKVNKNFYPTLQTIIDSFIYL